MTSTIGLFGTCGGSRWRNPFMAKYAELGIEYFNPQVDNWTPELAEVEAWHLVNDELILFPITSETYAAGSLAETGFSVVSALRWNAQRFVVIYVDPSVSDSLVQSNPEAARDSVRARKLVLAHLQKVESPNVFVVNSLDEMLETSINLYGALALLRKARKADNWRGAFSPMFWQHTLQSGHAGGSADAQAEKSTACAET
jgi:hypothetical protein